MNVADCAVAIDRADIGKILEVVHEIKDCINFKGKLTGEQEAIILRQDVALSLLLEVATSLQTKDDLPGPLNEKFSALLPKLEEYHYKCQSVHVRKGNFLDKLRKAPKHSRSVGDLEKDFEGIANTLTVIISQVVVNLHVEIKPIIINNPISTRKIALKRPHKVETFAVEENGDFLDISWNDTKNEENLVLCYEMMCNDGKVEILLPQLKSQEKVHIGEPVVRPGKYYTFKIRPVNKDGCAGEWSDEIRVQKKGVPERPTKPTIQVEGPNSVVVSVIQPTEDQSNGAPVTSCIVEYATNNNGNATMWESLTCSLKECSTADNKIKVTIDKLNGDTLYDFRVKFKNEIGYSSPSDSTTCQTDVPIPGIPEKLRVSTKRTSSMIKIRWVPSCINPEAVHHYELQIRTKKGEWHNVAYSTKTSAKATRLKQDKKYFFRVQALNRLDQSNGFSDTIKAETRFNKAARAAIAPFVFVGGTLASPFAGIGGGIATGIVAADSVDNKAGAAAAGVAAGVAVGVGCTILGTLGAPITGGAATYAFIKMTGDDDCSAQSSDEEEI